TLFRAQKGHAEKHGQHAGHGRAGQPQHGHGAVVLPVNAVARVLFRSDVDEQHARAGQEPADEAAAGEIVAPEKHKQSKGHNDGIRQAGDRLQNDRSHFGPPLKRRLDKMYTPSPASASTVISNMVSKPRKSTRMTLTTLAPWARGRLFSMYQSATVRSARSPRTPSKSRVVARPPPAASATLTQRAVFGNTSRVRRGKQTNTNRNKSSVTGSTTSVVSARSGARNSVHIMTRPVPTAPMETTAATRERKNGTL